MSQQIFADAAKGLVLGLAEIRKSDGKVYPLSAGPFALDIQDPGNTVTVVPGTPDQTTPAIFRPNGSLATGTVTITVTDTSNGLKSDPVSFDVVAPAPPPPPPDVPDTLVASLTPEP